MEKEDVELIWTTPAVTGPNRPRGLYDRYYVEHAMGERVTLLAFYNDELAGYANIIWKSDYPPFAEKEIPEINDLRVHDDYRRHGIGTALMDEAEKRIFERSPVAGIGVGMHEGYGPAQIMYARLYAVHADYLCRFLKRAILDNLGGSQGVDAAIFGIHVVDTTAHGSSVQLRYV